MDTLVTLRVAMDHDNLARSVHVMTTLTPTLLLTVIRKCESFLKSYAGDPVHLLLFQRK